MDSKLQIISGAFRGRKLNLPPNARPTQNRARIALFNMLSSMNIAPRVIWDAFAGSGVFGLECLSRWPDCRAVFTDVAPQTVRKNMVAMDINSRATIDGTDAMAVVAKYGSNADLIFLDPPYEMADLGAAFVRRLGPVVRVGTILIWEQDAPNAFAPDENTWAVLRDKQYGRARFLILQRLP